MRMIYATHQFKKDIKKIPVYIREAADMLLQGLQENPDRGAVKKLHGFRNPILWRIRIGSYRMIYSFDARSLTLHRIAHRKDIYKKITK